MMGQLVPPNFLRSPSFSTIPVAILDPFGYQELRFGRAVVECRDAGFGLCRTMNNSLPGQRAGVKKRLAVGSRRVERIFERGESQTGFQLM